MCVICNIVSRVCVCVCMCVWVPLEVGLNHSMSSKLENSTLVDLLLVFDLRHVKATTPINITPQISGAHFRTLDLASLAII